MTKDNITFVDGDVTKPIGNGKKYIVHCCNDLGLWGKGVVLAISNRWATPERDYKSAITRGAKLGDIQVVYCEDEIYVVNLIGQHGVINKHNPIPIKYPAIRIGLKKIKALLFSEGGSIHIPDMIGCGLAGGDRNEMIQIIKEELAGINVFVYRFKK